MDSKAVQRFSPTTDLRIDEVKIRLHGGEEPLVGWASCVLNGSIFLNNIAIVRGMEGELRLSYPSMRSQNDQRHFYFNPITRDAHEVLDEAILGRLATGGRT